MGTIDLQARLLLRENPIMTVWSRKRTARPDEQTEKISLDEDSMRVKIEKPTESIRNSGLMLTIARQRWISKVATDMVLKVCPQLGQGGDYQQACLFTLPMGSR